MCIFVKYVCKLKLCAYIYVGVVICVGVVVVSKFPHFSLQQVQIACIILLHVTAVQAVRDAARRDQAQAEDNTMDLNTFHTRWRWTSDLT